MMRNTSLSRVPDPIDPMDSDDNSSCDAYIPPPPPQQQSHDTMQQQQQLQQPLLGGGGRDENEEETDEIFGDIVDDTNNHDPQSDDYAFAQGFSDLSNTNNHHHESPMRGIQYAQANDEEPDEEQAGVDNIEVSSSSVVQRFHQREMEFAISNAADGDEDTFGVDHGHHTTDRGGGDGSGGGWCSKRNRVMALVALCAIGALVAGVVVGTTKNQRSNSVATQQQGEDTSQQDTAGVTPSPTSPPTVAKVTDSPSLDSSDSPTIAPTAWMDHPITAMIAQSLNVPEGTVWDPTDTEKQALEFVMNENVSNTDEQEMTKERFNMANLYYAFANADGNSNLPEDWMGDGHVCTWTGVLCGAYPPPPTAFPSTGVVTNLTLSEMELTGTIPTTFDTLQHLTTLQLHNNAITGSIPTAIGNAPALEKLNLANNKLTGDIPTEIASMASHLKVLDLELNSLANQIPSWMWTMTALEELNLAATGLTGEIPSEIGTSLVENLKVLNLSFNYLTGTIPTEIGALTALEKFWVWNNGLTGAVPSEIWGMESLKELILRENAFNELVIPVTVNLGILKYLDISWCNLESTIPTELGNLVNLERLNLGNNKLIGAIPTEIYDGLVNLKVLNLVQNRLTGPIQTNIKNMSSLQELYLRGNFITGTIPSQIGELLDMRALWLDLSELTGTLPSELGLLKKLRDLYINDSKISGSIPSQIGDMESLEVLSFENLKLTGVIPTEIGNLSVLKELDLENNKLTGTIPTEFGNLSVLTSLYLGLNDFEIDGSKTFPNVTNIVTLAVLDLKSALRKGKSDSFKIPTELGRLINLISLDLTKNYITGIIPTEIGNMENLEVLSLSSTWITGIIPAEIGNMVSLKSLDLSSMILSGNIPDLSGLIDLRTLTLGNNAYNDASYEKSSLGISGEIPGSLLNLKKLTVLALLNNKMTGPIPSEIVGLSNLETLLLSRNDFTGSVPTDVANMASLLTFKCKNTLLCGELPPAMLPDSNDKVWIDLEVPPNLPEC